MKRFNNQIAIVIVTVVIVLAASPLALAANPNPTVLPPNSTPYDKSYYEWSAEWWIWMEEAGGEPIFGGTEESCAVNQPEHGPWYLAGTFGWSDERDCHVPTGRKLLIPILNMVYYNDDGATFDQMKDALAGGMDTATDLTVVVDGKSLEELETYRFRSPLFTYPEGEFLGEFGPYPNSLADGYYVMLNPLPPGEHTISFGGKAPAWGFETFVTYNLTVGE